MYSDRQDVAAWIRDACIHNLRPLPRSVAIFGSFAGGGLEPESDIDLLLIGNEIPKKPFEKARWFNPLRKLFVEEHDKMFPGLPSVLTPVFMSEQGWIDAEGLRLSVSQRSWILWDDGFLSQSLLEASDWIRMGRWRKEETASGGWFWVPGEHAA